MIESPHTKLILGDGPPLFFGVRRSAVRIPVAHSATGTRRRFATPVIAATVTPRFTQPLAHLIRAAFHSSM